MKKARIFLPNKKHCGNTTILTCVNHWIWKRGKGLQVIHKSGLKDKSEYSLPELLKIENPREVDANYETQTHYFNL